MTKISIGRLLCMITLVTGLAASATATVVLPADLGVLSREARTIARGRVVSLDSQWTRDHHGVETFVTIEVESYLKGALGSALTFRVPGGRLGRYRSIVVGAPDFALGQRIVVFLGHQAPGLPYVLGLGQGVYRLVPTDSGWNVTPPAIVPAVGTATPGPIVRGDLARRPLALAAFESQVKSLAGSAQ
jgi:hypothetical protein